MIEKILEIKVYGANIKLLDIVLFVVGIIVFITLALELELFRKPK